MAFATLGKQIDIHTGGEDLKYTHHNGEIAQAESITKKQYVRYWMHNAHITIDNTKVAKSLGNGIRLKGLEDRGYPPESYRYWLLTSHYRSPANFSFEALDGAKQALYRLKRHIFEDYKNAKGTVSEDYRTRFLTAINDDLDTPKAIALMWEIIKDDSLARGDKVATLKEMDTVLALGLSDSEAVAHKSLGVIEKADIPSDVRELMQAREEARKQKDWNEADRIREEINMKGFSLEDTVDGPRLTKG